MKMTFPAVRGIVRVAVLGSALVLGACATGAPVHYYTLVGPPPTLAAQAPAAFDIDVLPVAVAPGLARRAMVLRTGAAQLMVQDDHQWSAPLPDELRAALSADLVAQLGTRDLGGLASAGRPGRPVYRVALAVRRFDAVYGARVTLETLWSVQSTDGAVLLTCSGNAARTVTAGYVPLVEGAQQALAAIAAQIAAALRALPQQRTCPSLAARVADNG